MSLGRKIEGGELRGEGGGAGFVPLHLGALLKHGGSDVSRAETRAAAVDR